MAAFALPMFWMVNTGSTPVVFFALLAGFTIHATMYGPHAALYREMVRATSATPAPRSATSSPRCSPARSRRPSGPRCRPHRLVVLGIGVIIAAASVTFVAVATIKERYRGDLHQTCEAEAGETVA